MKSFLFTGLMLLAVVRLAAQAQELQQLKLDLEKLAQFKLILSQMKQGYQNLQNGYNAVRDVSKGNFDLHKKYLDGLLSVNPVVKQSPEIRQVVSEQAASVRSYTKAISQFQTSGMFSIAELDELRVRFQISAQRITDNISLVELVTSSGKLRMSDAERLEVIAVARLDVAAQTQAISSMINDYSRLLLLRKQQKKDNSELRKLKGIK